MKTKPPAIPNRALSSPTSLPMPPRFLSQYSQGATIGGPLKISWPSEISFFYSVSCSIAHLLHSLAAGATLVFESKTKGAQMLTKKVSTFEKSERLSFLTQKVAPAYQPVDLIGVFGPPVP